MPTNQAIKDVIDDVDALDLSDGAHWMLVHQRLKMDYGDVFTRMAANPVFFDVELTT